MLHPRLQECIVAGLAIALGDVIAHHLVDDLRGGPLGPAPAQVALSVDSDHKGDGLGTELMARARSRAGLMGATGIELQMQGDNVAMIAVARRAGAPISRNGAALEATLSVPRPDLLRLTLALA